MKDEDQNEVTEREILKIALDWLSESSCYFFELTSPDRHGCYGG